MGTDSNQEFCKDLDEVRMSDLANKYWDLVRNSIDPDIIDMSQDDVLSSVYKYRDFVRELYHLDEKAKDSKEQIDHVEGLVAAEQAERVLRNEEYCDEDLFRCLVEALEVEGLTVKDVASFFVSAEDLPDEIWGAYRDCCGFSRADVGFNYFVNRVLVGYLDFNGIQNKLERKRVVKQFITKAALVDGGLKSSRQKILRNTFDLDSKDDERFFARIERCKDVGYLIDLLMSSFDLANISSRNQLVEHGGADNFYDKMFGEDEELKNMSLNMSNLKAIVKSLIDKGYFSEDLMNYWCTR